MPVSGSWLAARSGTVMAIGSIRPLRSVKRIAMASPFGVVTITATF
jgi:hypothetical protein